MNRSVANQPLISVVAPIFNEDATICDTLATWVSTLETHNLFFEIVLCDDASTDTSVAKIKTMSKSMPITLLEHTVNRGAGAALRTAINGSRGEFVILIDSDNQFSLHDALVMLEKICISENSFAIGVRRKCDAAAAIAGSRFTSFLANRIYGSSLQDFNCALKVAKGETLRSISFRTTRFNYSTEATARLLSLGLQPIEVEVSHRSNDRRRSLWAMWNIGLERLRFLKLLRIERRLTDAGVID